MKRRERKGRFELLDEARRVLELPDRASISRIRESYHRLSRRWHPDQCADRPDECHRMQQKINDAYKVLMDYCSGYEFSFRREDIEASPSGEELWWESFGDSL